MTERYFKLWGGNANLNGYTVNYSFTNNRIGNSGWVYDNDGRVTTSAAPENLSNLEYDAAGQLIEKNDTLINYAEDELIRHYDGDGRELKRADRECRLQDGGSQYECVWNDPKTLYYIRSSVFGGEVIAEAGVSGDGGKRMVRAGSGVLAYLTHRNQSGTLYDAVHFEHADALGVSQRVTRATPEDLFGVTTENPDYIDQRQAEFDPTGSSVGTTTNYIQQYEAVNQDFPGLEQESTLYVNGQQISVEVDGVAISFQTFQNMVGSGSVVAGEFRNGRYYTQHAIGSLSLAGGGISVFMPGDNNAPIPQGGNPNGSYGTRDRWEMISFGYSWDSQQRPPRGPSVTEPEDDLAQGKKCNIRMIYKGTAPLNNVTTTAPPETQIGPKEYRNRNGELNGFGFTFQFEAEVSGNPNDYIIEQDVYTQANAFDNAGGLMHRLYARDPDDAPNVSTNIFRGRVGNRMLINYADTPGIYGSAAGGPITPIGNALFAMNGVSRLRRDGVIHCSARWSIIQIVEDGRVVKSQFNDGRFLVSDDY